MKYLPILFLMMGCAVPTEEVRRLGQFGHDLCPDTFVIAVCEAHGPEQHWREHHCKCVRFIPGIGRL